MRNGNIILFIASLIIIGIGYGYVLQHAPSITVSTKKPSQPPGESISEKQDLIKLLETKNQNPEMMECNFSGTYEVTQDSAHSHNGAKCNDFEYRKINLNNITTKCQGHIDSKQELFLNCKPGPNPVTKCDGIVNVSSDNKRACEYWVTVSRVE